MKLIEILLVSLYLGLTSFGGPIAHLGYFHAAYVQKKKWVSEELYTDLVALCQFLPGPASSQVGIAIGTYRGGLLGGILAWIGFTAPSAMALVLAFYGLQEIDPARLFSPSRNVTAP
jgi:chromate transporter